MEIKYFYRVGNVSTDQGLWYDFNGKFTGLIHNEFNFCTNSELRMDFDPKTKSPISLLELGLYATSNKLHVICPDGFYRKGNIEIVCDKYNIPLYDDLLKFKVKFKELCIQKNKSVKV